jgi:hypothetical protein
MSETKKFFGIERLQEKFQQQSFFVFVQVFNWFLRNEKFFFPEFIANKMDSEAFKACECEIEHRMIWVVKLLNVEEPLT